MEVACSGEGQRMVVFKGAGEELREHTGTSRPALSKQLQGKCACGSTLVLRCGSDRCLVITGHMHVVLPP